MLDRRTFVAAGTMSLLLSEFVDRALAKELDKASDLYEKVGIDRIWLKRDNEEATIIYRDFQHNTIYPSQCFQLSYFWRDVLYNQAAPISVGLFDVVSRTQTLLSEVFGKSLPVIITSGYRTEKHNRTLEGAAQNSEHLRGRAIDLVLPTVAPQQVALAGIKAGAGGVGVYKNFTHLDVGQLGRRWHG